KLVRRNRGQLGYYEGGAGASEFNPASIPGLVFWPKADAITGLNDNDPVATWNDSSSQSNHITQGTAGARPLYKVNVKAGKPAVLFDGVDDQLLKASGATGLGTLTGYTCFVVASAFDTSQERILIQMRNSGNT